MPPIEKVKRVQVKVEGEGDDRQITAAFTTFGRPDLDNDIIERGAIGDQQVLFGAWNHAFNSLPPGYGQTFETRSEARFTGKFLPNSVADETYNTLKALNDAGYPVEFSWRFFVEEGGFETRRNEEFYVIRKAKVTHVAPVESGAGINTRIIDMKSCGQECQQAKAGQSSNGDQHQQEPQGIDYAKMAEAVTAALTPLLAAMLGVKGDDCGCKRMDQQKGETLGNLLRELRDEAEVTNDQLGDAAGISGSTVGQIMSGSIMCPPRERLAGFADRLNVSISRLISAAEDDGCSYADEDSNDFGQSKSVDDTQDKGQGLGDLIRSLRDEKGVSNDALAEAAGVSLDTLGGLIAGTTCCLSPDRLLKLAKALGVSLSTLSQAAETDNCAHYGSGEPAADDNDADDSQSDADGDADKGADDDAQDKGADEPPNDLLMTRQVNAFLNGGDVIPVEIDPGVLAFAKFQEDFLKPQEEYSHAAD